MGWMWRGYRDNLPGLLDSSDRIRSKSSRHLISGSKLQGFINCDLLSKSYEFSPDMSLFLDKTDYNHLNC